MIISIIFSRKQELRELKVLQKQEQKQFQDLTVKTQSAKDLQVCVSTSVLLTTRNKILVKPYFFVGKAFRTRKNGVVASIRKRSGKYDQTPETADRKTRSSTRSRIKTFIEEN